MGLGDKDVKVNEGRRDMRDGREEAEADTQTGGQTGASWEDDSTQKAASLRGQTMLLRQKKKNKNKEVELEVHTEDEETSIFGSLG